MARPRPGSDSTDPAAAAKELADYLPVVWTVKDPAAACVAELVQRGVKDDGTSAPGTARGYCLAPYRLQPTTLDEAIVLKLGLSDVGLQTLVVASKVERRRQPEAIERTP